ncbi:MAG: hypothetical protein U9N14_03875, partial [Pseudomonadota bacterium]|nr:hypothetical protein [Pseudomonadota bacterium]
MKPLQESGARMHDAIALFKAFFAILRGGPIDDTDIETRRLNPKNPAHAEGFVNRGIAFHEQGMFKEAIADYTTAMRHETNGYKPRYLRGLALYSLCRPDLALKDFETATTIDPNLSTGQIMRARTLMHLDRAVDALAAFDAALDERADEDLLLERAGVHLALNDHASALADCDKADLVRSDNPESWRQRARI